MPSGIADVDVLQVVARGRRGSRARPCSAGRRARGVSIAQLAAQVRAGQRRRAIACSIERPAGRPLEDHAPAVLARARPEVDDVVGRADRLLVVLDDDDRVAEIAQAAAASRAARGCRAGAGRSTARRARRARRSGSSRSASPGGCAGLRRPRAWRRCARASGSRRRRRRGSAGDPGSRCRMRSAMIDSRSRELERVEDVAAPRRSAGST